MKSQECLWSLEVVIDLIGDWWSGMGGVEISVCLFWSFPGWIAPSLKKISDKLLKNFEKSESAFENKCCLFRIWPGPFDRWLLVTARCSILFETARTSSHRGGAKKSITRILIKKKKVFTVIEKKNFLS